jgi:hypothetical protein
MNPASMPSPLLEGQSWGSLSVGMDFTIPSGPMDLNGMNPQYFKMNSIDPNMYGGMLNGIRPQGSYSAGRFNDQMTPQQMATTHQWQQHRAVGVQNWQNGPNGQMMPQPGAQGALQQMGTPQQRAMPPPSVSLYRHSHSSNVTNIL